ncbi:hypothetical protein LINPERHAP1_LOCUS5191 [Linum perenne]
MAVSLPSAASVASRRFPGAVTFHRPPAQSLPCNLHFPAISAPPCRRHFRALKARATLDEKDLIVSEEEELQSSQSNEKVKSIRVLEKVKLLKEAAKTRKVAAGEILEALAVIEKSKIDPSGFLQTLGGDQSPGRTWMLVFTAQKQYKGGKYFPVTAVQRFDADGKRIENGVYLGPLGWLTFEGKLTWKKRTLAFIFERLRIKIGPFNPLEIGLGQQGDREPTIKSDPFFVWFYIDEEIAVARGRSGGTAFWCRCRRVPS